MDVRSIPQTTITRTSPGDSAGHLVPALRKPEQAPAPVRSGSADSVRAESALDPNEEQYFEQLYPDSAQEIRAHNTYRRDGVTVAFNAGTVIDRKG